MDFLELQNKKALIVGSAGALGLAIASALQKQKVDLILHYRNRKPAFKESTGDLNNCLVSRLEFLQANLTDQVSCNQLLNQASKQLNGLDFVIICLGDFVWKPLLELELDEFRAVLESNLLLPFALSKAALPVLKKSLKPRIIYFGYANADEVKSLKPNIVPYQVAKLGLELMVGNLASSMKSQFTTQKTNQNPQSEILINCISPGICQETAYLPTRSVQEKYQVKLSELSDLVLRVLASGQLSGNNFELGKNWRG